MKTWGIKILLFFVLFFSTSWMLTKYDKELSEFNAKLTNLLRGNDFALRTFTKNGIPISNFARLGKKAISPFYVVHYGLIYSDDLAHPPEYDYLWKYNNSTKFWNVPPDEKYITEKNFYSAADWVVQNITKDNTNNYHLLYNFNWPYKHLEGGILKAPWHSGLTDGMALTLLSRAYILTHKNKYKEAAYKLYDSVINDKKNGGSTIYLENKDAWIEEYVVSDLPDNKQPRVLNGMIYSTFGVYFFEKTFVIKDKKYKIYLQSIRNHINRFDLGYWTAYDLIGTMANNKYHQVHLGLLDDLYDLTNDSYYASLRTKWNNYSASFIKRHFVYAFPTVNSMITFIEYIIFLILLESLIFYLYRRKNVD